MKPWMLLGPRHKELTTIYLSSLLRIKKEARAYSNSVPDQNSLYPVGQHTLALFSKYVTPMGWQLLYRTFGVLVGTSY